MKLSFGLVGGGGISHNHITAATYEGLAEFACGCFSRNAEKNREFASHYNLDNQRVYSDYSVMAQEEAKRKDKINFVIVCTPNVSHYDICKTFLTSGIAVVCDKPLTVTANQAKELVDLAHEKNLPCAVTYTFGGFPFIHLARDLYLNKEIGEAYFVSLKYFRGARLNEIYKNQIKTWRFTKEVSGLVGAVGDLGTHIEYLARFVTGYDIHRVLALLINKPGKVELDTTGTVLFEYENGLNGTMSVAQAACGHDNDIELEILGEKGTISWSMKKYNELKVDYLDGRTVIHRDPGVNEKSIRKFDRLRPIIANPPVMGFINIYSGFLHRIINNAPSDIYPSYPDFIDGYKGVKFIEACAKSQEAENCWINL